jgi:hypothetical protein
MGASQRMLLAELETPIIHVGRNWQRAAQLILMPLSGVLTYEVGHEGMLIA